MRSVIILALGWILPAGWSSAAPAGNVTKPGSPVIVEIDGAAFTLDDLHAKPGGGLFQAQNTFYEAQRKALEEFVDQYLLEQQAKKENLTVAELLQRHVDQKLEKEPSEEALRVYYDGLDVAEPYDAVRDKILDAIRQRRLAKRKADYIKSLRSQARIDMRLTAPRAPISIKDTPVRGSAAAPVVLVEYADYECPYCQQIQPALAQLEAHYQGELAFAFKDAPLPMHAGAQKAAEAAHCAGAQGKYWEYHDLLFTVKQFDTAKLKETARTLKLNGEAFDRCLDSGEQAALVKGQLAEAQALGVPGTPAFFVNGRFITGAISYAILRQIIDEELRRVTSQARYRNSGESGK